MTRPTKERIEEIREWAALPDGAWGEPTRVIRDLLAELDAVTADRAAVLEEAAEALAERASIAPNASNMGPEWLAWMGAADLVRSRAAQLRKEGGTVGLPVLRTCGDCGHTIRVAITGALRCVHPRRRATHSGSESYVDEYAAPPSWCPLRTSGKEGP